MAKYNIELNKNKRIIGLVSYPLDMNKTIVDLEEIPNDLCSGKYGFSNGSIVDLGYDEEGLERFKQSLRVQREAECFPYINRGELWYSKLTTNQKEEFSKWYDAWLNVTETLEIPTKPSWLD